jgi:hypothetical protein
MSPYVSYCCQRAQRSVVFGPPLVGMVHTNLTYLAFTVNTKVPPSDDEESDRDLSRCDHNTVLTVLYFLRRRKDSLEAAPTADDDDDQGRPTSTTLTISLSSCPLPLSSTTSNLNKLLKEVQTKNVSSR